MPAFRSGMGEKLGPKKKNINIFTCSKHDVLSGTANILEAVVNYWPIPLLHASSHDSINLGADRSDGAHGRVLCKCDEREVYSRKKKKIALFMCPTSQLLFQSSAPLPLRRDPQLCSGAVWSSCDWHPPLLPPHRDASHTTWGARVELALKVGHR